MMYNSNKKGFTLLELLIVIAVLAVLGAIVIFLLNPAEILKKARDSQRISDLGTIKTALGIYLTSVNSPQIDGTSGTANNKCLINNSTSTIWLSGATFTPATVTGSSTGYVATTTATLAGNVDGTGWIPVNLSSLTGGSPISNMPIDPINTTAATAVTSADLIYRYSCRKSPLGFEVDAQLESVGLASSTVTDGGNRTDLYEVGTDLTILGAGNY